MPMHQQPLTTPGGQASQGCGPKQEKGPKSGALVQARPNSGVILWVLLSSVMPSSPPGCWQRRRTGLAVVVSFAIWAGLERIALLRHPRRWRSVSEVSIWSEGGEEPGTFG